MSRLNFIDWAALTLTIVGAINWGLIGLFNFDLVRAIFGNGALGTSEISTLSRVIFAGVGLAGLWSIYSLTKISNNQAMMDRGQKPGPGMKRAA